MMLFNICLLFFATNFIVAHPTGNGEDNDPKSVDKSVNPNLGEGSVSVTGEADSPNDGIGPLVALDANSEDKELSNNKDISGNAAETPKTGADIGEKAVSPKHLEHGNKSDDDSDQEAEKYKLQAEIYKENTRNITLLIGNIEKMLVKVKSKKRQLYTILKGRDEHIFFQNSELTMKEFTSKLTKQLSFNKRCIGIINQMIRLLEGKLEGYTQGSKEVIKLKAKKAIEDTSLEMYGTTGEAGEVDRNLTISLAKALIAVIEEFVEGVESVLNTHEIVPGSPERRAIIIHYIMPVLNRFNDRISMQGLEMELEKKAKKDAAISSKLDEGAISGYSDADISVSDDGSSSDKTKKVTEDSVSKSQEPGRVESDLHKHDKQTPDITDGTTTPIVSSVASVDEGDPVYVYYTRSVPGSTFIDLDFVDLPNGPLETIFKIVPLTEQLCKCNFKKLATVPDGFIPTPIEQLNISSSQAGFYGSNTDEERKQVESTLYHLEDQRFKILMNVTKLPGIDQEMDKITCIYSKLIHELNGVFPDKFKSSVNLLKKLLHKKLRKYSLDYMNATSIMNILLKRIYNVYHYYKLGKFSIALGLIKEPVSLDFNEYIYLPISGRMSRIYTKQLYEIVTSSRKMLNNTVILTNFIKLLSIVKDEEPASVMPLLLSLLRGEGIPFPSPAEMPLEHLSGFVSEITMGDSAVVISELSNIPYVKNIMELISNSLGIDSNDELHNIEIQEAVDKLESVLSSIKVDDDQIKQSHIDEIGASKLISEQDSDDSNIPKGDIHTDKSQIKDDHTDKYDEQIKKKKEGLTIKLGDHYHEQEDDEMLDSGLLRLKKEKDVTRDGISIISYTSIFIIIPVIIHTLI